MLSAVYCLDISYLFIDGKTLVILFDVMLRIIIFMCLFLLINQFLQILSFEKRENCTLNVRRVETLTIFISASYIYFLFSSCLLLFLQNMWELVSVVFRIFKCCFSKFFRNCSNYFCPGLLRLEQNAYTHEM